MGTSCIKGTQTEKGQRAKHHSAPLFCLEVQQGCASLWCILRFDCFCASLNTNTWKHAWVIGRTSVVGIVAARGQMTPFRQINHGAFSDCDSLSLSGRFAHSTSILRGLKIDHQKFMQLSKGCMSVYASPSIVSAYPKMQVVATSLQRKLKAAMKNIQQEAEKSHFALIIKRRSPSGKLIQNGSSQP